MTLAPLTVHLISFKRKGENAYSVLHAGETPTPEQRAALDLWLPTLSEIADDTSADSGGLFE